MLVSCVGLVFVWQEVANLNTSEMERQILLVACRYNLFNLLATCEAVVLFPYEIVEQKVALQRNAAERMKE